MDTKWKLIGQMKDRTPWHVIDQVGETIDQHQLFLSFWSAAGVDHHNYEQLLAVETWRVDITIETLNMSETDVIKDRLATPWTIPVDIPEHGGIEGFCVGPSSGSSVTDDLTEPDSEPVKQTPPSYWK